MSNERLGGGDQVRTIYGDTGTIRRRWDDLSAAQAGKGAMVLEQWLPGQSFPVTEAMRLEPWFSVSIWADGAIGDHLAPASALEVIDG